VTEDREEKEKELAIELEKKEAFLVKIRESIIILEENMDQAITTKDTNLAQLLQLQTR
jgi:hypothetical protein